MSQHASASAASSSFDGTSSTAIRPRPPKAEKEKGRTAENKEAIRERNLKKVGKLCKLLKESILHSP
eukprot:2238007-Prorocentrum_lima.AAC.1